MITKDQARMYIKAERSRRLPEELRKDSLAVCRRLIDSDCFRNASSVFAYASLSGEVETCYLSEKILACGKILALPKVTGSDMTFYRIEDLTKLSRGAMGILEPDESLGALTPGKEDLIVMPGLAFDRQKHRVGYGGGYYDRYLQRWPEGHRIALAFSFQILEDLEHTACDICPEQIILPHETIQ